MPGSAPLQALQELAFLAEACLSLDVNSHPLMGCSAADMKRIAGWLAEVEQSLGGTTSSGSDALGLEPVQGSASVLVA